MLSPCCRKNIGITDYRLQKHLAIFQAHSNFKDQTFDILQACRGVPTCMLSETGFLLCA